MAYRVGDVARLAGVSVRTLHHYHAIGLLEPSDRSAGGYRLYATEDLERLQQVLFFKELGFALDDVRRIMGDPGFDRREALLMQRRMLDGKVRRTQAMIVTIDKALEALEKGVRMNKDDMFEVFGDFNPDDYREEARSRFDRALVEESERRTAAYTKDDWKAILAEQQEIVTAIADRMDHGPDDGEVQELIERHRRLIDRRFYPCPPELYVGLGDMYVSDPRFTEFFEKIRPGLASFMRDAMRVRAESEVKP